MKIWIEQNLLMPLFFIFGLLFMITLCLTSGFAASVQGLKSGVIVLSLLWGALGVLGVTGVIGYAFAERCPRCGKRFSLIIERWIERTGQDASKERHKLLRCKKCGYTQNEG